MLKAVKRLIAVASVLLFTLSSQAQPVVATSKESDNRPYKVLTTGKQVTIKSSKEIRNVMLWTNGGNRLVEQKDIRNSTFTFTIPVSGRYFYLMIGLANGKVYTEKLGLQ